MNPTETPNNKDSEIVMDTAKNLLDSCDSTVSSEKNLMDLRDSALFNELGKMTRDIHNILRDFRMSVDDRLHNSGDQVGDAKDNLELVTELMEDAAMETIKNIEESMPHSEYLANESHRLFSEWSRFERREMSRDEFVKQFEVMMHFLDNVCKHTDTININMQNAMLAQEYQDICGQILSKVVKLITDVEMRLVNLVKITGEAQKLWASVSGQELSEVLEKDESFFASNIEKHKNSVGPAIANKSVKACSQDDVDSLLAEYGF